MDPQQRILLHTAYEALEDAGYVPNSTPTLRPDRFGCFIGAATHDYVHNLKDEIDVYYSTGARFCMLLSTAFLIVSGTLGAFLSGRISYAMKMSGPSMVVDTACSSSLVAVYHGARALMNRDCDAAMVGGVNVISSPDVRLHLPVDVRSELILLSRCFLVSTEHVSSALRDSANHSTLLQMVTLVGKAVESS